MMKIYDKLKQIENKFNGNEYFEHGVSFCIGFDALDINIPLKKAVKNVLVEYKAICEPEDIKLEKISDFKSDISELFMEWHLDVISIDVIEALDTNYQYQLGEVVYGDRNCERIEDVQSAGKFDLFYKNRFYADEQEVRLVVMSPSKKEKIEWTINLLLMATQI